MLQSITEGTWGSENAKINQMFDYLTVSVGITYIPIWEGFWVSIRDDLNSNFEDLYTALGGTGRQEFLWEESWGDIRDKMNTMFVYLYFIAGYEVEFEVTGSPPIEGVGINVYYRIYYESTAIGGIGPSTVTFSNNYFTVPLTVSSFAFFDEGVQYVAATEFGGWGFTTEHSTDESFTDGTVTMTVSVQSGALQIYDDTATVIIISFT